MREKVEHFIVSALCWPALLFPRANSGETLILMLLGVIFWVSTAVFGAGFLFHWLISR